MDTKTIVIPEVDIPLLRKQRDHLLSLPREENVEGVIHLLDAMLDIAERGD